MTIKNILPAVVGLVCICAALLFASTTHANPSAYATTAQTSSATTSPAYLTPAIATSTLIYDSYAARPVIADKASMGVQFTGSSTTSVLSVSYEYTNGAPGLDCLNAPGSCDWYKDNMLVPVTATTSQSYSVNLPVSFSWTFASSTQGGSSATSDRSLKMFTVPTPTRYVRAIFTITGANGAVWAQIVPAKENS